MFYGKRRHLQQLESIATNNPRRIIRKPARFADIVAYAFQVVADGIPTTFNEALQSSEEEKRRSAINEEMKSLHKNYTWQVANMSERKRLIECKWVFA